MKSILAENIKHIKSEAKIDFLNSHPISTVNWGETPKAMASVSIANDSKNIFLHYEVLENNVLGRHQNLNDPVYQDSCVEFFISFDNTNYYNFEFNCIGTLKAQYGIDRSNRVDIDNELLKTLEIIPSLGYNKITVLNSDLKWELDIVIPIEAFQHTQLNNFSSVKAKCNFYKCGDDLPEPHFLSWNPVNCETPDFHKPEFFGELTFSS